MLFPLSALLDPATERLHFGRSQRASKICRRHPLLRISVGDALKKLTLARITGSDQRLAKRTCVEPQIRLALGRVRPVTFKTIFRENRPHISIEPHRISTQRHRPRPSQHS